MNLFADMHLPVIVLILTCHLFCAVHGGITCRDNNDDPVDWFIVMKYPKLRDSDVSTIQEGVGQLYMDVNNQKWTLLSPGINSTGHAVYNTLQQIYAGHNKQDMAYALYNDEIPDGPTSLTFGHTKGAISFDQSTGFWLVHSVPKFPPPQAHGYSYPETGHLYGQTFLCVTYKYKQLNPIGGQLLYNYPQFYDSHVPKSFSDITQFTDALNGQHVTQSPWNQTVTLTSDAGQSFLSFAKSSGYGKDLYDAWVAPTLQSNLNVETWGRPPLPSNCSVKYKVLNVDYLNFLENPFDETSDHSKWAVSDAGQWICIGDINRMKTQWIRAGGTVCSKLPKVAAAFQKAITKTQPCSHYSFDTLSSRIIL